MSINSIRPLGNGNTGIVPPWMVPKPPQKQDEYTILPWPYPLQTAPTETNKNSLTTFVQG